MLALLAVLWIGRFDADPDPDPTFHYDADPDPDPDSDRHKNNGEPLADPTSSFTQVRKLGELFTYVHSNASLQRLSFIVSGKCAMILSILDSKLKFS
jgi:hypothetical protein